MAAENIGELYPTKIPGYIDDADIQAALRVYHYGSYDFDPNETDPLELPAESLAYHLYDIQVQVDALDARAYTSSQAQTNEPVAGDYTPEEIPNGSIWLDTDANFVNGQYGATAIYTTTAPTTNLVDGIIWIKKGSTPLELYVYNSYSLSWDQVI